MKNNNKNTKNPVRLHSLFSITGKIYETMSRNQIGQDEGTLVSIFVQFQPLVPKCCFWKGPWVLRSAYTLF